MISKAFDCRHECDFAESSVSAIAIPFPVYDFSAINILRRERPHDSELSRDDLQATPYEINHETCFSLRFPGGTSDVNLSESEKAFPLYDAARHLTRLDFQALTAKFYKLAEAGDSKITSL
jgi:hypothetical protein